MPYLNEKEIKKEVYECDNKGRLNPEAIGWSRHPYHICNLRGSPLRKKRWDYWCFLNDEFALSITLANVDYLGLASGWFYNFKTKTFLEKNIITLFGKKCKLGQKVGEDVEFNTKALKFSIKNKSNKILVDYESPKMSGKNVKANIIIEIPDPHETLNVLIPWSKKRFQFTSKQNAMPITGSITVDDQIYEFKKEKSFAILDFGRGKWKYKTDWNWGSFSGWQNGNLIGINLGAGWTDGTGYTENGVYINGKLYKIHDEVKVNFDKNNPMNPWEARTIHTDELYVKLMPIWDRSFNLNLGLIKAKGHQCFGYGSGTIKIDSNEYKFKDFFGFIEDCHYRW